MIRFVGRGGNTCGLKTLQIASIPNPNKYILVKQGPRNKRIIKPTTGYSGVQAIMCFLANELPTAAAGKNFMPHLKTPQSIPSICWWDSKFIL